MYESYFGCSQRYTYARMASDESEHGDPGEYVDEDNEELGFPGTDLTLVVEGRKIHVNKNVLSEHSAVFDTMFKSKLKESTAQEIILEGKKAENVVKFLKCFYPNMEDSITGNQHDCTFKNGNLSQKQFL